MSDLLEFAGVSELSDGWGTLKEFEFLQDIPQDGLEFWWSADKITDAQNGDAIQTLTNETGGGSPTQGTLAARAIYRTNSINGKPALDFDGVDDVYITSGVVGAFSGEDIPLTIYAVTKADLAGTSMFALSLGRALTGSTAAIRAGHVNTGNYRFVKEDDAGVNISLSTGTTSTTTPILRVDSHPGTTYSFWENETNLRSGTSVNVGTLTLTRFAVGASYVGGVSSLFFNGQIAEILLYSAAHSEATRLLISRYLKNKYRLYL